jgi:hypothetical protein
MYKFMFPLYDAPTDSNSSGTTDKSLEDDIEFLSEDDEELIPLPKSKESKEVKEKDTEKEKDDIEEDDRKKEEDDESELEVDELEEIEKELEPPTDEQLELIVPVRRRDILNKYPKLFKEFPYLEKAYYREQQFTELLPTIDDAKTAVEKGKTLDNFERDLVNGDTETILKAVKNESPKGFKKIVDEYLPTLARVDEASYHHVIGTTIKHTIMAMVAEGRRGNNIKLQEAAQLLNQFVFGSSDFTPPSKLSVNELDDSKDIELQRREQEFVRRQFQDTQGDLNTRVNNSIRNTIESNIDPKQSMTDYVRRQASREALESITAYIDKDTRFKALVDKLWEKAFQESFSKNSVERIRSAYVSKARTLLPSVIKKARNEALKGMGKRVKDDDEVEQPDKKGQNKDEKPHSQSSSGKKITNAKDIPKGMRTIDFLMQD